VSGLAPEAPAVSLIIPAYNEVRSLAGTIDEAHAYFDARGLPHEIIAAVEGDDGTVELAHSLAAGRAYLRVSANSGRRGKGFAIRRAVPMTTGAIVGFADADNKTPIDQFDGVRAAFDGGADLVIGSRAMAPASSGRSRRWYRRIGTRVFAVLVHGAVGLRDVPDTQCGFKFFRSDVARAVFSRQVIDGYMFDVEVLCLARDAGYRLAQVPVRWRDDRDSRLHLVRGNLRNVADIGRIQWNRLARVWRASEA
jgi:dolichyl-phosphate beta-glucosyltransferase